MVSRVAPVVAVAGSLAAALVLTSASSDWWSWWWSWIAMLVTAAVMGAIVASVLLGRRWRTRGPALLLLLGLLAASILTGEWRTDATVWALAIVVAVAFAASAAVVLVFSRWWARGVVLIAVLGGLAAIRLMGADLFDKGWRDIDGWVDCWPTCSRWHLLGVVLYFGPALVTLVLTGVVCLTAIVEQRRLRARS